MAVMGTARAHFSLGRYADALKGYQEILAKMPQLQDPDPRIGIGCCFWQLGYREEARESWERALELVSSTGPSPEVRSLTKKYRIPSRRSPPY